jgi:CarboxypepD_reg-like domain
MSRQAIHIALTNPCDQRWEDMMPNGEGRFCTHCQTTVIDFTTWTDRELYEYFASHKGRTCGQFLETQLDRPIQIPHQPQSRLYRMTIAMGLTLLFTQTPQLYAQNNPPRTTQTLAHASDQGSGACALKGKVMDGRVNEPLINAYIQLFQNGQIKAGNITDYDGNYIFKPIAPGEYDMIVSYNGYDSAKRKVTISADTTVANFSIRQKPVMLDTRGISRRLGGGVALIPDRITTIIQDVKTGNDCDPRDTSKPKMDNPDKHTFKREDLNNMGH